MSVWETGNRLGKFMPGLSEEAKYKLVKDKVDEERSAKENQALVNYIAHSQGPAGNLAVGGANGAVDDFGHAIRMNVLYDSDEEEEEHGARAAKAGRRESKTEETNMDSFSTLRIDRTLTLNRGRRQEGDGKLETSISCCACCTGSGSLSLFSRVQGALQATLRPAALLGCSKSKHAFSEEWVFPEIGPAIAFMHALTTIRNFSLSPGEKYEIQKADQDMQEIVVHVYTHLEFLDVMTIRFQRYSKMNDQHFYDKGCVAWVHSFSTGIVPTCIPCAPFFNLLCCWLPFSDMFANRSRIDSLRRELRKSGLKFEIMDWR